jgi:hypothetical protein
MANREEREKSSQSRRRLEAKILTDEKRASEITFCKQVHFEKLI